MKLEYFLTPYTKINSKGIRDLDVGKDTITLLQEIISKTFNDINHSKILHNPPSRLMETKTEINKWELTKFKSFHTAKQTINKVQRQSSEGEKIIPNETTDK